MIGLKEYSKVVLIIIFTVLFVILGIAYTSIIESRSTVILVCVTSILTIITLYYAITTAKILKESQKDRRIRFLENKLKNLYMPIIYDFKECFTEFIANQNSIRPNKKILLYMYLAGPKLREILEKLEGSYESFSEKDIKEIAKKEYNEYYLEINELSNPEKSWWNNFIEKKKIM